MRRPVACALLLALAVVASAGAGAPRARVVLRAPLPALAEAAVANDGTTTWVVFRPDDSPPYAARVSGSRLVPGPRVSGVFSPSQLLGATAQGLWLGTRSGVIRVSPTTGRVTLRLTPPRHRRLAWHGAAIAAAPQLLWSGSLAVEPRRGRLLGDLGAMQLAGAPVRFR